MLTARGEEADRIVGLEIGRRRLRDQAVLRPRELVARVRTVLRRADAQAERDERLEFGDLTIDPAGREVTRGGGPCG